MTTLPPFDDYLAIQQLVHDFWSRTDRVSEGHAEDLFSPEARSQIGPFVCEDRDAIVRYNVERRAGEDQGGRKVRHFCTNLLFEHYEPRRARLRVSMLVFQGVGPIPLEQDLPSTIADFAFEVLKDETGSWSLSLIEGTPIFLGPGAPVTRAK